MNVRVARGTFAPELHDELAERLRAAEAEISGPIRELPGLIDYYAGIDRASSSMIRVSVWDTEAHAESMSELPQVRAVRAEFEAKGVVWEPVITYEVAWWVQSL